MRVSTLVAVAAMAAMSASQPSTQDLGYKLPNAWAPSRRDGNNKRKESAKRHSRAKAAYKSKRAQHKKAKR